jgi:hypothetical protein
MGKEAGLVCARLGVMRLYQIDQCLLRHHSQHPGESFIRFVYFLALVTGYTESRAVCGPSS